MGVSDVLLAIGSAALVLAGLVALAVCLAILIRGARGRSAFRGGIGAAAGVVAIALGASLFVAPPAALLEASHNHGPTLTFPSSKGLVGVAGLRFTKPVTVSEHAGITIPVTYPVAKYLDLRPDGMPNSHAGDSIRVFADSALTEPLDSRITASGSTTYLITPSVVRFVDETAHDSVVALFSFASSKETASWGPYSTFYVVRYLGETGRKLADPLVTRVNVTPEGGRPGAPAAKWSVDPTGHLGLAWRAVSGAASYDIFAYGWGGTINAARLNYHVIGKTTSTTWNSSVAEYGGTKQLDINSNENIALDDAMHGSAGDESDFGVGVVAVGHDGTLSYADKVDLGSALDHVPAGADTSVRLRASDPFPDGLLVQGVNDAVTLMPAVVDVAASDEAVGDPKVLHMKVPGTAFDASIRVTGVPDGAEWAAYVNAASVHFLTAKTKTGAVLNGYQFIDKPVDGPATTTLPRTDWPSNGVDAMAKFLGANMSMGNAKMDVSKFIKTTPFLVDDVLHSVVIQNPYVIGVQGWSVRGSIVTVSYDLPAEAIKAENEKTFTRGSAVVAQVIKPGMTVAQKALALNDFLVANATYNDAAVTELTAVGNRAVDEPAYRDSWTAAGVLVDGTGVCASYAEAYQLLSDLAAIRTVSVTGDADGAHEWNKTFMAGKWQVVDPTWNDDPDQDELFGITDAAAKSDWDHVPDPDWTIPALIPAYAAN